MFEGTTNIQMVHVVKHRINDSEAKATFIEPCIVDRVPRNYTNRKLSFNFHKNTINFLNHLTSLTINNQTYFLYVIFFLYYHITEISQNMFRTMRLIII